MAVVVVDDDDVATKPMAKDGSRFSRIRRGEDEADRNERRDDEEEETRRKRVKGGKGVVTRPIVRPRRYSLWHREAMDHVTTNCCGCCCGCCRYYYHYCCDCCCGYWIDDARSSRLGSGATRDLVVDDGYDDDDAVDVVDVALLPVAGETRWEGRKRRMRRRSCDRVARGSDFD